VAAQFEEGRHVGPGSPDEVVDNGFHSDGGGAHGRATDGAAPFL
jgi:hypothetical protein